MVNLAPIAADDGFSALQGSLSTTITGHLGSDNGAGADYDPDGSLLGWVGLGFNPVGDGDRYLGAFFSGNQLGFLIIAGTVSYPFPVWVTTVTLQTNAGGTVILNTDGSFAYSSPAGFSGEDWFEYTLVDGSLATDIGRVTLTVTDTATGNDRPLAQDDSFTGTEDQPITGNLLADNGNGADSDPNGDGLTLVAQTVYTAQGGVVTISATGSFSYVPRANYFGSDSFSYTLRDSFGASDTGTVTLDLAPVNDAPVARDDSFSAAHGTTIAGNVMANNGAGADADADNDPLSVVAAVLVTAGGGQVALNSDGTFTYVPDPAFVGQDSFSYTLQDSHGASATATVTLNQVNTAPVARPDWFTASFGNPVGGNVLANNGAGADSDAEGDTLVVAAGVLTTAFGGVVSLAADGGFTYTPAALFYGTDSFQYAISDGFGGTATATAFITTAAPAGSIYGTSGDDTQNGTDLANVIFGLDGDDLVHGLGGNDLLAGGNDKDTLWGEVGGDRLYGQSGKDALYGGLGADRLDGGSEGDDLFGNEAADQLTGGAGNDTLTGGAGNDWFIFDSANGSSADKVMDFRLGDKLVIRGADYGLAVGALADASYFASGNAAAASHGRFLYSSVNRSLAWDADGDAATANVVIATFNRSVALGIGDFLVI